DSFVAGVPTNVQFMIKDSKKFASTGGLGVAQFTDGKPDSGPAPATCFSCHGPAKDPGYVFTPYSPCDQTTAQRRETGGIVEKRACRPRPSQPVRSRRRRTSIGRILIEFPSTLESGGVRCPRERVC